MLKVENPVGVTKSGRSSFHCRGLCVLTLADSRCAMKCQMSPTTIMPISGAPRSGPGRRFRRPPARPLGDGPRPIRRSRGGQIASPGHARTTRERPGSKFIRTPSITVVGWFEMTCSVIDLQLAFRHRGLHHDEADSHFAGRRSMKPLAVFATALVLTGVLFFGRASQEKST